jgi:hypothetical protein
VWCGVVWCGVVWCGVVWCGVVWCGVVWCGGVACGVGVCARRRDHSDARAKSVGNAQALMQQLPYYI